MHILMDLRGAGPCSEADFILGRLLECCELCWAWVADGQRVPVYALVTELWEEGRMCLERRGRVVGHLA